MLSRIAAGIGMWGGTDNLVVASTTSIFAFPHVATVLWLLGDILWVFLPHSRNLVLQRSMQLSSWTFFPHGPSSPMEHLAAFSHKWPLLCGTPLPQREALAVSSYTGHMCSLVQAVPTPPSDDPVAFSLGQL